MYGVERSTISNFNFETEIEFTFFRTSNKNVYIWETDFGVFEYDVDWDHDCNDIDCNDVNDVNDDDDC